MTGLTCKYDAWNRLVEVDNGATVLAQYAYDGLGRKIEDFTYSGGTPTGVTHYYYGAGEVIETRVTGSATADPASVAPQYQYVWSGARDAPILRDTLSGPNEGQRIYYLTDANNNVTAITDATGDVQQRYLYTPYGSMQTFAANWTPDSDASGNTILFAGQQLDSATGLYYMNARWYNPLTGDFITRDPLGFAAGDANLYRYAGGNPVSRSDPTGLAWNPSGGGTWDAGGTAAGPLSVANTDFAFVAGQGGGWAGLFAAQTAKKQKIPAPSDGIYIIITGKNGEKIFVRVWVVNGKVVDANGKPIKGSYVLIVIKGGVMYPAITHKAPGYVYDKNLGVWVRKTPSGYHWDGDIGAFVPNGPIMRPEPGRMPAVPYDPNPWHFPRLIPWWPPIIRPAPATGPGKVPPKRTQGAAMMDEFWAFVGASQATQDELWFAGIGDAGEPTADYAQLFDDSWTVDGVNARLWAPCS